MQVTELKESTKTLQSVISKLEKCAPKLKDGSPQMTLLNNRLKAFNLSVSLITFYTDLLTEQEKLTVDLEVMKSDGKEKTVRYREMLGQKLMNKTMLESIQRYVKT